MRVFYAFRKTELIRAEISDGLSCPCIQTLPALHEIRNRRDAFTRPATGHDIELSISSSYPTFGIVCHVIKIAQNLFQCKWSRGQRSKWRASLRFVKKGEAIPVRPGHALRVNMNLETFKACSLNLRMSSSFCRLLYQCDVHPSAADTLLLDHFQFLPNDFEWCCLALRLYL